MNRFIKKKFPTMIMLTKYRDASGRVIPLAGVRSIPLIEVA